MFEKDARPSSDVSRILQERREIPLYAAIHAYNEFEKTLHTLLEHSAVRHRTAQLARLCAPEPGIATNQREGDSAQRPIFAHERETSIRAFHEKFCLGMRKTSSPIAPQNLRDTNGAKIDSAHVVTYTDLKMGMLRTVVRSSLEQIFQRPGDLRSDQTVAEKLISLTSTDGLSFFEKESIRAPAVRALVGAFADLVSSTTFSPPATLSPIQVNVLNALFSSHSSLGHRSESLLSAAIDDATRATLAARRIFIRGTYDGKLPQELLGVKAQEPEKVVSSVIESLTRIQRAVVPQALNAERVDFEAHAFGDTRASWAAFLIPPGVIKDIETFLKREDVEQVVHRAHNIGTNRLRFLLPEAFERAGLPRSLWPHHGEGPARTVHPSS